MQISSFYEREDPRDGQSKIIKRCLVFKSPLKEDCIRKIATKYIPMHATNLWFRGVENGNSEFIFNTEDVQTSAFPIFIYQIMNWEGNLCHHN